MASSRWPADRGAVGTRPVRARVCACFPQRGSASPCLAPLMAMMCSSALAGGARENAPHNRQVHPQLAPQVRISESPVGYLYQQVYLPLLACHERQHHDRLAQTAKQQGGLIVALDGLAPQGGEPQIWFIRELSSGLTLRSGWLCQQDQPTFEAFLEPLKHLEWPILAVLSDKQTGLVPAVATVLPHSRYQFCQAHYLRNLAEPLAEADAACKRELRQTVRAQVGDMLRQEPRTAP